MVRIEAITVGSPAHRHGLRAGDELVGINGHEIHDVLDYRFYLTERVVTLTVVRDGVQMHARIVKGEYEDIGLSFETALMSEKQRCKNGCIFCFIDQNPKGMRDTIYFKDDDARLSFLHGNYVTLTNMTEQDVDRILAMHLSPVNVSVHTTNPELRVRMMRNKHAGEVLGYLDRLFEGGIAMHGQIVVCRGVNDGEELMRSMRDLSRYYPVMSSVSIVPAGLTAHRQGLYPLADFTKDEAGALIDAVERFAEEHARARGGRMFFLADEFYLKAERPIPGDEYYEDYEQIENGVGLLRSLEEEVEAALRQLPEGRRTLPTPRTVSLATGVAAYEHISSLCARLTEKYSNLTINVYKIINHFFGESITVSGLLTGQDMLRQLRGKPLGEELLVPANALRAEDGDFLCGMQLAELSSGVGAPVRAVASDGFELVCALLGEEYAQREGI